MPEEMKPRQGRMERIRLYREQVKARIQALKWNVLGLYLARRDPRVPLKAKVAIALAVGYFLSPLDLIPDFIPVIGQLDELVIVSALVGFALRSIPPGVLDEYRARAKVEFRKGTPKAYMMAILIAGVWVLALIGLILMIDLLAM